MGATAKIATAPGEETGDMSGSRAQTTADLSATNTVYFTATRSAQMRQEVASLDSDSPNGTALRRHVTWLSRRPKGLLPTWPQAPVVGRTISLNSPTAAAATTSRVWQ